MIHQYKLNGFNIVLDTYSGGVHCVDDLSYDIIGMLDKGIDREEIKKEMLEKYSGLKETDLEETFGDSLTIQQYDLDDDTTQAVYEDVIDQLYQFEQSLYGMGPMYAIEGYFAKVGYTSGDETYIVDDIQKAVEGKTLSDELSGLRFSYFNH